MTREEATLIARHIAAGACAMQGYSPDYCEYMRNGAYDGDRVVQATIAALTIAPEFLDARIAEIRAAPASNVVELAA